MKSNLIIDCGYYTVLKYSIMNPKQFQMNPSGNVLRANVHQIFPTLDFACRIMEQHFIWKVSELNLKNAPMESLSENDKNCLKWKANAAIEDPYRILHAGVKTWMQRNTYRHIKTSTIIRRKTLWCSKMIHETLNMMIRFVEWKTSPHTWFLTWIASNFENIPLARIFHPVKNETISCGLQRQSERKQKQEKKKKKNKNTTIGIIFSLAKIFVRHPTVGNLDATGGGYFLPWKKHDPLMFEDFKIHQETE